MNPLLTRLELSLTGLPVLLGQATPAQIRQRSRPEQWSAHENLTHLGRYQQIFIQRLQCILSEDNPSIGRYRAEEDPDFALWVGLETAEVVSRTHTLRAEMLELLRSISASDWNRTALHPVYGQRDFSGWLELFLVHEGHHLYLAMLRLGEAIRDGA